MFNSLYRSMNQQLFKSTSTSAITVTIMKNEDAVFIIKGSHHVQTQN